MESPIKAIVNVFKNVSHSDTDNTSLQYISDFENLNLSETDLSQDAINALKEGRKIADEDQKEFEKVVAKNSKPVTTPEVRTRTQAPSKSDIVKGEDIELDEEEQDQDHERTLGRK